MIRRWRLEKSTEGIGKINRRNLEKSIEGIWKTLKNNLIVWMNLKSQILNLLKELLLKSTRWSNLLTKNKFINNKSNLEKFEKIESLKKACWLLTWMEKTSVIYIRLFHFQYIHIECIFNVYVLSIQFEILISLKSLNARFYNFFLSKFNNEKLFKR